MQSAKKSLDKALEKAAESFKLIPQNSVIRVVSHLDADGICAASIAVKALQRMKRKHSVAILPQLDDESLRRLSRESYPAYIFADFGSSQLEAIGAKLKDRSVFVLDHHRLTQGGIADNICFVNPHSFGADGSKEISGAGVVYLFFKALNEKNADLAYLAVIGALGDSQERMGFRGQNTEILKDAVKTRRLVVRESLRIFGAESKTITRLLEYCYSPYIPGVTGSREGAISLLRDIGINPRVGTSTKRLAHLTGQEIRRLAEAIQKRRLDSADNKPILGPVYIVSGEADSPFRDAREFATLLNACGRMGKPAVGIGACLGDEAMKHKSLKILQDYRRAIVNALDWYETTKESRSIQREEGLVIINARGRISPTIIGTLASIISKSEMVAPGTVVLAMSRTDKGMSKVSMRASGRKKSSELNLEAAAGEIIAIIGKGESGGHRNAAGALISTRLEGSFIETARMVLKRKIMEEKVE